MVTAAAWECVFILVTKRRLNSSNREAVVMLEPMLVIRTHAMISFELMLIFLFFETSDLFWWSGRRGVYTHSKISSTTLSPCRMYPVTPLDNQRRQVQSFIPARSLFLKK